MIGFQRRGLPNPKQGGFSLIEVLIGLVLSGLLMSMVAMVLGQSVTNNEVVRSSAGLSSRIFTLRRILHRDLQNRKTGNSFLVDAGGFSILTSNNNLIDGGVTVKASWDFRGNMIHRHESAEMIEYSRSFQLMRGVTSWRLELLDGKKGAWIPGEQYVNMALSLKTAIKAIRINLSLEDGQNILIVERVPYVFE